MQDVLIGVVHVSNKVYVNKEMDEWSSRKALDTEFSSHIFLPSPVMCVCVCFVW